MKPLILALALLISSFSTLYAEEVVYVADFTGHAETSATKWLKSNNFSAQAKGRELKAKFENNSLLFQLQQGWLGGLVQKKEIKGATKVRITWGVNKWPEGQDWEDPEKKLEPLSVILTFGKEPIQSDSYFYPAMPYFFSIFMGQNAKPNKTYLGRYYHKGGRFFCGTCDSKVELGKDIVYELEFHELAKKEFGFKEVPAISAIGIEFDLSRTTTGAEVYLKKIEYLK